MSFLNINAELYINNNKQMDFSDKDPFVKVPKQGYIECIYIQASEEWFVIK